MKGSIAGRVPTGRPCWPTRPGTTGTPPPTSTPLPPRAPRPSSKSWPSGGDTTRRGACRRNIRCSTPSIFPSRPTSAASSAIGIRGRPDAGPGAPVRCAIPRPDAFSRPSTSRGPSSTWSRVRGRVFGSTSTVPTHHWAISAEREASRLLPAAEAFSTVRALLDGSFTGYPAAAARGRLDGRDLPRPRLGRQGRADHRPALPQEIRVRPRRGPRRALGRPDRDRPPDQDQRPSRALPDRRVSIPCPGPGPTRSSAWSRRRGPDFRMVDAEGKERRLIKRAPGACRRARRTALRIEFIASDVPALGYRTFYVVDERPLRRPRHVRPQGRDPAVVENDFYRIELAPRRASRASSTRSSAARSSTPGSSSASRSSPCAPSAAARASSAGSSSRPWRDSTSSASHGPDWLPVASESGPLKTVYTLEQPLRTARSASGSSSITTIKRIDCEVASHRLGRRPLPRVPARRAGRGGRAGESPTRSLSASSRSARARPRDRRPGLRQPRLRRGSARTSGRARSRTSSTPATTVRRDSLRRPSPSTTSRTRRTTPVPYPVLQPILLASRRSCHGEGNWYLQEGDHHYRFSLTSHAAGWRNGCRAGHPGEHSIGRRQSAAADTGADLPESMSFLPFAAPNWPWRP